MASSEIEPNLQEIEQNLRRDGRAAKRGTAIKAMIQKAVEDKDQIRVAKEKARLEVLADAEEDMEDLEIERLAIEAAFQRVEQVRVKRLMRAQEALDTTPSKTREILLSP